MRSLAALARVGLCAALLTSGCAAVHQHQPLSSSVMGPEVPADVPVRLPDPRAGFDYQLGGAYSPPPGATVVERDRTDEPAGAGYDICYVNGFQTQPAESKTFAAQHPDLVVKVDGQPAVDPAWPDEYIYDTSTEANRASLAAIVGPWINGCKSAGYSAVEIDNLDSYDRADDALTAEDNIAMAILYMTIAHNAGLAIAQKNTPEVAQRLRAVGYDFAINESCFENAECSSYSEHYPVVLDVEYSDELTESDFATACTTAGRPPAMILRDRALAKPTDGRYVYQRCAD